MIVQGGNWLACQYICQISRVSQTTVFFPSQPPISEPEYVDSRHVKAMKVLNRVQREYEQAVSNTLPRNAFSALEQEKLASLLQQQPTTNGSTNRYKKSNSSATW